MTLEDFAKILQEKGHTNFKVEITQDSRILLKVEDKTNTEKTIKINSCFLNAPPDIIDAIGRIILGKKKKYDKKNLVKYARRIISSQKGQNTKIDYEGKFYNLKYIFDSLNERFFNNCISSRITYGRNFSKERSRSIVFGNYKPCINLIRINRALDNASVPEFFIRYIVFHEMLHAYMYLSGANSKGHSKIFKKKELSYPELKIAEKWKKENLNLFIKSKGDNSV